MSQRRRNPAALDRQRAMLRELGFGFVESAPALPEASEQPARRSPPPPAQNRRKAPAKPSPRGAAASQRPSPPLSETPALSPQEREAAASETSQAIANCQRCGLELTRNHPLSGGGPLDAAHFLILDMPTADEDRTGERASGELGDLLLNILKAMKLSRDDVFIAYSVRCRPPAGRTPRSEELEKCHRYLNRQIEIVRPGVIVCFGAAGLISLIPESREGVASERGQWREYRGIPVMTTYSLTYMNRMTDRKKIVWEDLKKVMAKMEK